MGTNFILILFSILLNFIVLGFTEAVIKPIAIKVVRKQLVRWTPVVLCYLDELIPSLFNSDSKVDLDTLVRNKFFELTGEDWSKINIDYFWELYDPRITLFKLNNPKKEE